MKNVHLLVTLLFAILLQHKVYSQCDVSPDNTPDIVSNNSFSGSDFDWDDAGYALSSNNQYASAGFLLGLFTTVQSDLMMLSDFDISIPLAVTICGIEIKIERKASGLGVLGASVRDNIVQLVRNGSVVGTNKATSTNWTGSKVTATYGGPSDLWGTSWNSTDVNSTNFGLAFSAELRSGAAGLFLSADIDNITVTVYYQHIVLPGPVGKLTANTKGSVVELIWKTAEDHNIKEFFIERQSAYSNWEKIASFKGTDFFAAKKELVVYDLPQNITNQYRARLLTENGATAYSDIVNVQLTEKTDDLSIYVNQNNKTLTIRGSEAIEFCRVICLGGKITTFLPGKTGNNTLSIPSTLLPDGHFIVQAQMKGNKRRTQQFCLRK